MITSRGKDILQGIEIKKNKILSFRALDDIRESIKELQFYKSSIFKVPTETKNEKIVENGSSNNS